jgi:hypothetical protein
MRFSPKFITRSRFSTAGPVVRNGVAVIVACGNKSGIVKGMIEAVDYAPEPYTGPWWNERRGECTVWYYRPPDWTQRLQRIALILTYTRHACTSG